VPDNDTPPNTYIQSATRTNEWRTAIAADNATGTITITVTYTGGTATRSVTLSDTFCGVPTDDTPPTTDTPPITYDLKVDPRCSWDVKNRVYVLVVTTSGDSGEIVKVVDSIDPAVPYTTVDSGTVRDYGRRVDSVPTTTVTFTVVMSNDQQFTADLSTSDACGRVFNVEITDITCDYQRKTGWARLTAVLGGVDADEVSALRSDWSGAMSGPTSTNGVVTFADSRWEPRPSDSVDVVFTATLPNGTKALSTPDYPPVDRFSCGYVAPDPAGTPKCQFDSKNREYFFLITYAVQSGANLSDSDITGSAASNIVANLDKEAGTLRLALDRSVVEKLEPNDRTNVVSSDNRGIQETPGTFLYFSTC